MWMWSTSKYLIVSNVNMQQSQCSICKREKQDDWKGWGKSSNQKYQDLSLHELQLSKWVTVMQELCQPSWRSVRERKQWSELRDGEEEAGEKITASEQRAGRLQLDLPHTHTDMNTCTLSHIPFLSVIPPCSTAASWVETQSGFSSIH